MRKWVLSGSHIRLLGVVIGSGRAHTPLFRSSKVRLSDRQLVRLIASSG